jgi:hemoglobin
MMNAVYYRLLFALSCVLLGACAGTTKSEAPPAVAAAAPNPADALKITPGPGGADDALYREVGGLDGVSKLVDAALAEIGNDLRINVLFAETDMPYLRARLIEQICEATGGPCTYTGQSMEEAHSGMNVSADEFGYFVEDLIAAMKKVGVSDHAQQGLLGALGSMQPQVVGQ